VVPSETPGVPPSIAHVQDVSLQGALALGGALTLGAGGVAWLDASNGLVVPSSTPGVPPSIAHVQDMSLRGALALGGALTLGAGGVAWLDASNGLVVNSGEDNVTLLPTLCNVFRVVVEDGGVALSRRDSSAPIMWCMSTPGRMRDSIYRGSNVIEALFSNIVVDIDQYYGYAPGTLSNATPTNQQLFVSHDDPSNTPRTASGCVISTGDETTKISLNCDASSTDATWLNWMLVAST